MTKSFIFLAVFLLGVVASAGYREECTFAVGPVPQFKTSIDINGPNNFGKTIAMYPVNGGQTYNYSIQQAPPQNGELFRFLFAKNPSFIAFAFNRMQPGEKILRSTIFMPSGVYGTQMSGVCKYVGP